MNGQNASWGKIGIVLCGGGYKGFRQALCLRVFMKWLETHGLKLSHITAGSVGAYNAVALAENPSSDGVDKLLSVWDEVFALGPRFYNSHPILLEKLNKFIPHSPFHRHESWNELKNDFGKQWKSLMNITSFVFSLFWTAMFFLWKGALPSSASKIGNTLDYFFDVEAKAFFDPLPFLKIVRRRIDFQRVIDSSVELFVISTRFRDLELKVFSNRDLDITPDRMFMCVLASAALYPAFELVEIDANEYEDGDVANPLPIDIAFQKGCDTVFAFLNTPACLERTRGTLLEDALEQSIVQTHKLVSKNITEAQKNAKVQGKNLFIFRPSLKHKNLGVLSVTPEAIAFHKVHEFQDMKKYFSEIDKYNLRYLPNILDYRSNPDLYKGLDGDVKSYLRNL